MIQRTVVVFDQHVQLATATINTTASLDKFAFLERADRLTFLGDLKLVKGGGCSAFSVTLQTSGDGRTWIQKNANPEVNFIAGGTVVPKVLLAGGEPATVLPTMGFAQLAISVSGSVGDVYWLRITGSSRSYTKQHPRVPLSMTRPPVRRAVSDAT